MTMTTQQEINQPTPLDANQRCDRCPAHAAVVVLWPDGNGALDLMFCLHHWRDVRPGVLTIADVVVHIHPLP